ncbi:hypothetical protein HDU67_000143 [Dinochytrium kinnereticum]|nr:hypothetical protein HDU67_000143 [Dinochytrium kinnereticum]
MACYTECVASANARCPLCRASFTGLDAGSNVSPASPLNLTQATFVNALPAQQLMPAYDRRAQPVQYYHWERLPEEPTFTNADDDNVQISDGTATSSISDLTPTVVLSGLYPSIPTKSPNKSFSFTAMVTVGTPTTSVVDLALASLDLITVVDVSGSMTGAKIDSVKSTLHYIVDALAPTDRLSIVKFNSSAQVVAPFLLCSSEAGPSGTGQSSKARLVATVNGLGADGGTSIYAGLDAALKMVGGRRTRNRTCAIVLLSDGQDSMQGSQYDELVSRAASLDTAIFTFGYGVDHDDAMLLRLAGKSGTFTFIRSPDMVQDAFAGCIGGIKSTMFQKVTVKLSVGRGDAIKISKIICSYDYSVDERERQKATIQFGDLFAGETRDAIVLLELGKYESPADPASATLQLLHADYSFTSVQDGRLNPPRPSEPLVVSFHSGSSERPDGVKPDTKINRQLLRLNALKGIREANAKADDSQIKAARAIMLKTRQEIIDGILVATGIDRNLLTSSIPSPPPERSNASRSSSSTFRYTIDSHPLPEASSLAIEDWQFFLAVLEDVDRATSRFSSTFQEYQSAGHRASQKALVSTYTSQRVVYSSSSSDPAAAGDGSALGMRMQSKVSATYQQNSSRKMVPKG